MLRICNKHGKLPTCLLPSNEFEFEARLQELSKGVRQGYPKEYFPTSRLSKHVFNKRRKMVTNWSLARFRSWKRMNKHSPGFTHSCWKWPEMPCLTKKPLKIHVFTIYHFGGFSLAIATSSFDAIFSPSRIVAPNWGGRVQKSSCDSQYVLDSG
jgi:hypothetical protein